MNEKTPLARVVNCAAALPAFAHRGTTPHLDEARRAVELNPP